MILIGKTVTKDNQLYKVVAVDTTSKNTHPWYKSREVILQPLNNRHQFVGESITITRQELEVLLQANN